MKKTRQSSIQLGLALAATTLCTLPASAQDAEPTGHPEHPAGQIDAYIAEVPKVTDATKRQGLRRAESRSRTPGGDIQQLAYRIDILRAAHAAWAENGNKQHAETMGRFIRVGEMQLDGAPAEELERAFAGMRMGTIIELLQGAHKLYADWGDKKNAMICNDLADFYAKRERDRARVDKEGGGEKPEQKERRVEREMNLEDLERRLDILRMAHTAYREAGDQQAALQAERCLHLGELQLVGASDEEYTRAAEGITPELLIELLRGAHDLWADFGHPEEARACHRLAEFYAGRASGGEVSDEGEHRERDSWRPNLDDKEQRVRILEIARDAHAEVGHEDAAHVLERVLHLSRLQLEGADGDAVARASEGLSMEQIIDLVQRAAGSLHDRGRHERAELCASLAEFYVRREEGAHAEEDRDAFEDARAQERAERELERAVAQRERRQEAIRREHERMTAETVRVRERAQERVEREHERALLQRERMHEQERREKEGLAESHERRLVELMERLERLEHQLARIEELLQKMAHEK